MIFEALYESALKGELLLLDGGYCRWHLRRDHQVTILEIIATRPGAGSEMFEYLKTIPGAKSIYARCPADLASNKWYAAKGFILEETTTTNSGRGLKCWRYQL